MSAADMRISREVVLCFPWEKRTSVVAGVFAALEMMLNAAFILWYVIEA